MLTKTEEFAKLDDMIKHYDDLIVNDKLTPAATANCQKTLDALDKKYGQTELTNLQRSSLLEMQALLDLSKGRLARAQEFIRDAQAISPGAHFTSRSISNLVATAAPAPTTATSVPEAGQTKRYSGKIEGWLIVYALRIIILPIILFVDVISSYHTFGILDTSTTIGSNFSPYFIAALIGDTLGLLATFYIWSLFFTRKAHTRQVLLYFEGYLVVYYVVFAFWLQGIVNGNNITDTTNSVGTLGWGAIIASLWFFYWLKSKRVKATFTL